MHVHTDRYRVTHKYTSTQIHTLTHIHTDTHTLRKLLFLFRQPIPQPGTVTSYLVLILLAYFCSLTSTTLLSKRLGILKIK